MQPSPLLLAFTIPEYESHLDHAGLIGTWNAESLKRGEAIYQRVCANCHGTKDQPGSLPTSLRFAEGKFKNGSDPLAMYHTLTRGFGLMAPQTWMVPSQKYDVIHYIRETYLRPHNPSQFAAVDAAYLARLPKGDTRGPEPSQIEPWTAMDYGPSLTHTYEVPGGRAQSRLQGDRRAARSRGRRRLARPALDDLRHRHAPRRRGLERAASKERNFIDWRGIQFNGEHQIHPRIVGPVAYANSTGPGWANPVTGSFRDDQRVEGRDHRRYGPLPRDWGRFRGQYHHGQHVVLSYSVGSTDVLELPHLLPNDTSPREPLFLRTFNLGPRERDLVLQIAEHPSADSVAALAHGKGGSVVTFQPQSSDDDKSKDTPEIKIAFDGGTYLEVPGSEAFDVTTKDFTIAARLKTTHGGSIFALAPPGPKWTPDGQTLFVRDGRLGFDIGWVGAVTGKAKIADGRWHNVASPGRKRIAACGCTSMPGSMRRRGRDGDRVGRRDA